jgi:hypothetical protein
MDHFNFNEIKQQIEQSNREIMTVLANQAQNYFVSSWRKQGFDGKSWQEVQRRIPGTQSYKYPKTKGFQRRTQQILVGAGFKKRGNSLRAAVGNMSDTKEIGKGTLRMIVDLPYAKAMNEGTDNAGRGHSTTIPARPFIKQVQELTDMQGKKITQIIDKIWKK